MIIKILIGLVIVLVILAIVIALQPADFRVTRSATMAAPPEGVFEQVDDLKKWEAWSPWAKMDATMKQTYEGPATGVGAISRWTGNAQVGEGSMTITESRPNELVGLKLQFLKPFVATNEVQFTFKPEGDQTLVTWDMTGTNNFMAKGFNLIMNMEKMCGDQFNQGLASMKSIVETRP
ncbi:polyketide cyclase [Phragmitibacter flavus]|uniref:Polyketide cyclase n=1 Tax=Phragmitibacter flavus TaxID=2576071 RepID=A0A5R8KFC4_9BACT|nr:SRPBCC family protein [Phragmitibacter flavus]TLD70961.1 polyketide cyclase [Phragmitibacter flavus]